MKRTLAMADNCIDVYYKLDRYYLTGNSIDFALNYKDLGGDVTEITILGNDVFADALEERLKERKIPLRILKRTDRPTAAAKMDLVDGDKKHLHFEGNAMEEIELQDDDLEFVKQFDIIYAERWAKVGRYIKEIRQEGQIWVYDFSKRLEQESNDEIIPYLDYAFFSYDRDDEYVRNFMVKTSEKGAKTVVAMLGEYGSLAYENGKFYKLDAEKVEVVNTVGAGDSYIAAFTNALEAAKNILANKDNAIQADVDDALTVLTDAKDKLVLVQEETVNLKALQDKVAEVEKFLAETKTEYTKESMKALKDALADAKAILADPKNAKQADVDNALKTLTKAKEGLVPVTSDSKGTEAAKQEAKAPVTGDHSFAGITLLASMLCLAAGTIVFVKRKHI